MTELEEKLFGVEFVGIVENNTDPDKKQRVQIRIPYLHGTKDLIPTEALPWAHPFRDNSGITYSVPEINKVVNVTFPSGNPYYPVYKNAQHLNVNLQKKIETYDGDDYASFVALCYNYNMQMYFDKEQFELYYKKNGLKIKEDQIIIQKKDPSTNIKLGNENADQSMMLGDNWMDFFNEFMQMLPNAYMCTTAGSPAVPSPQLIQMISKFNAQKNQMISKTIFIVDNLDQSTNDIEIDGQVGDKFDMTKESQQLNVQQSQLNQPTQSAPVENRKEIVRDDIAETSSDPVTLAKTNSYTPSDPDSYIKEVSPAPTIIQSPVDVSTTDFTKEDLSYINDEDYYANEDTGEDGDEYSFYLDEDTIIDEDSDYGSESADGGTVYSPAVKGTSADLFFNYGTSQFNQPSKAKQYPRDYVSHIDPDKIRLKGTVTKQQIMDMKRKLEGGLGRSKEDSASAHPCPTPYQGKTGWHTNKGITYNVWVSVFGRNNDKRFLNMSDADWEKVFTEKFWNKYQDKTNVDVSALKVFIVWGSGPGGLTRCLKGAEKILGTSFNSVSPERKVAALLSARYQFLINISNPPGKDKKWRTGWVNAINKYLKLIISPK